MTTIWRHLGIANAGAYLHGSDNQPWRGSSVTQTSCTTYDTRLEAHYGRLTEGGVVTDKRTCDQAVLIRGILSGPLVDITLEPGTVSRFRGQETVDSFAISSLLMSGWGPFLAHGIAAPLVDGYSSLDKVSLDLFVAFWLKRGARVGYRKGDSIHWHDGIVEPIDMDLQR